MTRAVLYLLFGTAVLGLLGGAEYRGWSPWPVTRVQGVPRSVRDNPGAYRSIYRSSPRYFGGK